MKVSVFKNFLNGERIATCDIDAVVQMIRRSDYAEAISDYRCASPAMLSTSGGEPLNSGVRTADNNIPRLCFASEFRRRDGRRQLLRRNALVLLEIDGLTDYATAASLRRAAARQPYTLLTFVGANGRSVEIVCRAAMTDGSTPCDVEAYRRMMAEAYKRLHYVYSAQLGVNMPLPVPADDAMCLMSADTVASLNPQAVTFAVDPDRPMTPLATTAGNEEESPLPGKTPNEARRYIFYSCWNAVLNSGLDAASPYFAEQAVAMLARYCRRSGLPEQMCVERASLIDASADGRHRV